MHHYSILFQVRTNLVKKVLTYGENYYINNHYTIHSEIDAINKLRNKSSFCKKNRFKNVDLLVIKISKTGSHLGLSKPCNHCIAGISNIPIKYGFKIKKILYSDQNGNIIKTTISELFNSKQHISKYYRRQ